MAYKSVLVALAAASAVSASFLMAAAAPTEWRWRLPDGVAPPPVPADNPMSQAKVALGRRLFYDTALSADRSMACASCHQQAHGFADTEARHVGVDGSTGKRNPMSLTNVAYDKTLTWADPAMTRLEDQAKNPMLGNEPVEMGMGGREAELVARLEADLCYPRAFADAFPEAKGRIQLADVTRAIAAFERTLVSFDSPYDRFQRGDKHAISDQAAHGAYLFTTMGCDVCHAGPDYSDDKFHQIGLPDEARDRGIIEKTGKASDVGKFRTTTLRNIALTGPYMHDGSVKTLHEAVMAHTKPFGIPPAVPMTDAMADDIVTFMQSLTDEAFVEDPELGPPPACPVKTASKP